jgi:hypothetical protein
MVGTTERARWTRYALLAAVAAAALALLPGAHGTVGVTCTRDLAGQVRIVGQTLRPATIRIGPGRSVTWIACGAGSRRIESTSRPRAWTAFTLRPNQQRRVVFNRVGRYPYRLNGKVNGVVIVAVLGTAPPGQGQNERTVRYDVRVEANYAYRRTIDGGPAETRLSYVGNWRNVAVKVFDSFGTLTVNSNKARGTIDGKLTYLDAIGAARCQGELDYPPFPARVTLAAGRPKGSRPYVAFDSDVEDQGDTQDATRRATQACSDLPTNDTASFWPDGRIVVRSVEITPPGAGIGGMNARFDMRQGATGIPFPLDRLRDGRGFTIVGERTIATRPCGSGCTESSTGRVEFRFTPRR